MPAKASILLHGSGWTAPLVHAAGSHTPAGHAIRDFVSDSLPVIGEPWPVITADESFAGSDRHIFVSVVDDPLWKKLGLDKHSDFRALRRQRESFIIRSERVKDDSAAEDLILAAADDRAAMYAIYELSERIFGTDPLFHWSDYKPSSKEEVFWSDGEVCSGEPEFKYRGFFINDEDALMAWRGKADDGLVAPEVHTMIIETVCRLRGNMLAPPMWAGYMDDASATLLQERGLFYTASHLEVLLSNPQNYWAAWCREAYGTDLPYSYTLHSEKLERYWRETVQKHAGNANIWPLGLRGNMDCAFWESDPAAPSDMKDRAKVVSKALAAQLQILREETTGSEIVATLTMRDEVLELYLTGDLEIPESVILIWDDLARKSRMRRLPDPANPAEAARRHGVYYHLNYCQNPRMQYLPFSVLVEEFGKIHRVGANEYALFNVGNVRELSLLCGGAMRLAWKTADYIETANGPERLLAESLKRPYANAPVEELKKLYNDFFDTEYNFRVSQVTDCVGPLITSHELYEIWNNTSILDLLEDGVGDEQLVQYATTIEFSNLPDRCWCFDPSGLDDSLTKWEVLMKRSRQLMPDIPARSLAFYQSNLHVQIATSYAFNRWAISILMGMKAMSGKNWMAASKELDAAASALEELEQAREEVSRGKWENWYRGEYHNVFDKSLWTLKPRWHAEDCRRIARLLKERVGTAF